MKGKRGFTLVELLVVMAIIAILASIVVPNVVRYISRARLTRAVSEVNGMQLSLTAILTDAGRGNLTQLFEKNKVTEAGFWPTTTDNPNLFNPEMFENALDLYTRLTYDLIRMGRDCMRSSAGSDVQAFMQHDLLAKLGTNYMDVGLDPWGQVYRIWPGPWRFSTVGLVSPKRWPIPFRIFSVEASSGSGASNFAVKKDEYMLRGGVREDLIEDVFAGIIEDYETWPSRVGLPAEANKPFYIWSYGNNNMNSQMLYRGVYAEDPLDADNGWYNVDEDGSIGGGDDINNWDSGTSWQRFYQ